MNKEEKEWRHRADLARQKGEELKLNPILVRETKRIRAKFGIPEDGFTGNESSLGWQRTIRKKRLKEWSEEVLNLRLALGKQQGWEESLERYLRSNTLIGPLRTVSLTVNIDIMKMKTISKSLKILDEPINLKDVKEVYEEERKYEGIPIKKPRLYNFELQKKIYDLSVQEPKLSDKEIAERINDQFDKTYTYHEIGTIRKDFKKRLGLDE